MTRLLCDLRLAALHLTLRDAIACALVGVAGFLVVWALLEITV